MTTTAEVYGGYDMKERARLRRVLLKEFEQNAALTGILERRRRLDERTQYELQGREGMDASINRNLAPLFRAGMAGAATSAAVAAPALRPSRADLGSHLRPTTAAALRARRLRAHGGSKPEPPLQRKPRSKCVIGTRGDRWH